MRTGMPDETNPIEEEPDRMVMQSVAWAQGIGGGSSSSGTLLSLIPFVLIFVIFYFLLILPQQKRAKQQKALLEALKKGDKVITASGIWGTVTNLGKETVTLQIADSAKIRIQREHIARLRADDEDKDKDS
jgi:preprotein translocase subunit YajC